MAMPQEESRRLRAILDMGCSSVADIMAACQRIESAARNSPRSFFRNCFPSLLQKIFGFESFLGTAAASPTAWLSVLSQPGNEAASNVLVNLLSPEGTLIRAMLAADKENVVRYVFPYERLPDWVRRILVLDGGPTVLEQASLLYKNRIKEETAGGIQVELDIFQYYIFWFAYYAVCKEVPGIGTANLKRPGVISRSRTQIENWIPALHQHHQALQQPGSSISPLNPYLQLLHLYLAHFVGPEISRKENLQLWQADDQVSLADIFLQTVIDFWLDPCPFTANLSSSQQLYFLNPPSSVYSPPGTDVTDAVKLLVNYFSALLQSRIGNIQVFDSARRRGFLSDIRSSPPPQLSTTASSSPYLLSLQRPLYRFFLRALCFWPVSTPLGKMAPLLDVWLHYLEPWTAILLVSNDSNIQPGSRISFDETRREYSAFWQGYVVSNYLFYTSLVLHFLDFALKFLDVDMEAVFQMTIKILTVLSRSNDLLDLLKRVESAYAENFSGRHHSPFADRIPKIQDQLKDWEEGVEQEQGEMTLAYGSRNLHFFYGPGKTAHQILQAMVSQAEAENQACTTGKLSVSPKTLEAVRNLARGIFDQEIVANASPSRTPHLQAFDSVVITGDASRSLGLQRRGWAQVRYKGDWMRRPIESHEIGWLVKLLVNLSDRINASLGFSGDVAFDGRNKDMKEGKFWAVVRRGLVEVLVQLKKWGFRVNLRPLACKQMVVLFAILVLGYWISLRVFR